MIQSYNQDDLIVGLVVKNKMKRKITRPISMAGISSNRISSLSTPMLFFIEEGGLGR